MSCCFAMSFSLFDLMLVNHLFRSCEDVTFFIQPKQLRIYRNFASLHSTNSPSMQKSESRVSEIVTVPLHRFLKGAQLLANGRSSTNAKSTGENGLVNGSNYNDEMGDRKKHGRAFSCGNEVFVQRAFAHTSGTNDALHVNKEGIKEMIVNLLQSELGTLRYDHKQCSRRCLKLSEIIETNVRKKCLDCKVVSSVHVGALRDKGPAIARQSFYSEQNDCFALAYYSNKSLFASAAVFVVRL